MTCFPGSTGRFTPNAAAGTTVSSSVTLAPSGPTTLITTPGTRGAIAASSCCASSTAWVNAAEASGGMVSCAARL